MNRQIFPLESFFRNPDEGGHLLSPDGVYLAWLEPFHNRMNVFIRPVHGGEARRVTQETSRDITAFAWKRDCVLYLMDEGGDENFHIFATPLSGEGTKDLTPGEKLNAGIIDELYDDNEHIIIAHNRRDPSVHDVFRINITTGSEILLAKNPGNIIGWLTDQKGRLRVATATDGAHTALLYREDETRPFRSIAKWGFRKTLTPLLFTFDDEKLYVASNRFGDRIGIYTFNPKTAQEEELIYEHPEVDVSGLDHSRKLKRITRIYFTTWRNEEVLLGEQAVRLKQNLSEKLPGYDIDLTSTTLAEDKYIVATSNDRTFGKRYLYDSSTDELTFLTETAPWLPEDTLCPMRPIAYRSRDGLTINGYLTLPQVTNPIMLPVVVYPHPGPWSRDSFTFDPEVQFLANRGYAVLQMNFRGSTGYGRAFWEAGFRQWGRAMQDDITDGVHWLMEEGVADPKRIAIYGASYGGYAALAGLAFTPELYAAGVAYVGISDPVSYLDSLAPQWNPMRDMMYEMVGHPVRDRAFLEAVSPLRHADRIRVPVLIAQGANDSRVGVSESERMVRSLRHRGHPVEYLCIGNEGHGFQNEENRFAFYGALEKFLERHLQPAPSREGG